MKNFTFIKNVKGTLIFKLSSYDMLLPERTFAIPHNIDRIVVPEQYALGLFVSSDAYQAYQEGYFKVEEIEELEKAASLIGFFADSQQKANILDVAEIEKILVDTNVEELDKLLSRGNYIEMTNMIGIAREYLDKLPKNIIDKIENACGVELEIE